MDLSGKVVIITGSGPGLGPAYATGLARAGTSVVAQHKANVYIDPSGWSPKYCPPQLVRAADTMATRTVLFGSDYPLLSPERWTSDFGKLEIKDDVRPLIMKDDAVRALGLR